MWIQIVCSSFSTYFPANFIIQFKESKQNKYVCAQLTFSERKGGKNEHSQNGNPFFIDKQAPFLQGKPKPIYELSKKCHIGKVICIMRISMFWPHQLAQIRNNSISFSLSKKKMQSQLGIYLNSFLSSLLGAHKILSVS